MQEIWKPIKQIGGYYEASSLGRVRSLDKKVGHPSSPKGALKKGKILKLSPVGKTGYLKVSLVDGKRKITALVHRLVAAAFYGESELTVDHINGNKLDNRVSNLEYCTMRKNNNRYFRENNASGFLGVSWKEPNKKYESSIHYKGRTIYIGLFPTAEEASNARVEKEYELGFISDVEYRERLITL